MHARWTCAVCGAEAGRIDLDDAANLTRTSFTSTMHMRVGEQARAALASGDVAALHRYDLELVPWWCPSCERSYCGDHWRHWDAFDDDGFHDSIRGQCPAGHERMLED